MSGKKEMPGETHQAASSTTPSQDHSDVQIHSLGQSGDREVRKVLRKALKDAWPAARRFGWSVQGVCELPPDDADVGYTAKDGTIFVKIRDPVKGAGLYQYSFVLATLLHEFTHLSVLGHGKGFYRRLSEAVAHCNAEPAVRREVRSHVCGELLNAVCENDARRAKALLAVMPEAARCRPPGPGRQGPLEYAAHHGRVALTKLLLQAKADPDTCCGADGIAPLARAAAQGNSKTARVLLEAGAMRGLSGLPRALTELAAGAQTGDYGTAVSNCCKEKKKEARRSLSLPTLPTAQGRGGGVLGKGRRAVMLGGGGSLSL